MIEFACFLYALESPDHKRLSNKYVVNIHTEDLYLTYCAFLALFEHREIAYMSNSAIISIAVDFQLNFFIMHVNHYDNDSFIYFQLLD